MLHLKNNYFFFEFLSQGRRSEILLNKIQALLIFDPLITLSGHFKAPYFKMLNDARVASACLYVRTSQRVRNSKNIATIRDFQVYIRVNSTIKIQHCFNLTYKHVTHINISIRLRSPKMMSEVNLRSPGIRIKSWISLKKNILTYVAYQW